MTSSSRRSIWSLLFNNTSWPPQQKSIVLQYWKPKINSFSYAAKKKKKKKKKTIWHLCTNFWINPHNGKLSSRPAPAQCQNSQAPQLLSNNCWSKTKASISLNQVFSNCSRLKPFAQWLAQGWTMRIFFFAG